MLWGRRGGILADRMETAEGSSDVDLPTWRELAAPREPGERKRKRPGSHGESGERETLELLP